MSNWIVFASAEHVQKSRLSGFMQVCRSKSARLLRRKSNDWVVLLFTNINVWKKRQITIIYRDRTS